MTTHIPLTKESILKIRPLENQRQIVRFFNEPKGFGVRISKRSTTQGDVLTHTFIVRKEVHGQKLSYTIGPVKDFKKAEDAKREAIKKISEWNQLDPRNRAKKGSEATFGQVLEAYVSYLNLTGKKSASTVKNTVQKYIRGNSAAGSKLWRMRADDVMVEDIIDTIKPIMSHSPHTAEACRQHIKAAFNKAIDSLGNIELPQEMRDLNIRFANPCTIKKLEAAKTVRERYLTDNELHSLLSAIERMNNLDHKVGGSDPNLRFIEPRKAFALFHIFTGGQRSSQLAELTASSIVLDDGKPYLRASRHQKRTGFSSLKKTHRIPLTDWILETIEIMGTPTDTASLRALKKWEAESDDNRHFIWSLGKHDTPISNTEICKIYSKRLNPMLEEVGALDPSRGRIQPNSIRKTVETLLRRQPWSVPADHIGWLQDHGVGGVQNTHYNQYDYFDEKLDTLTKWYSLCTQQY